MVVSSDSHEFLQSVRSRRSVFQKREKVHKVNFEYPYLCSLALRTELEPSVGNVSGSPVQHPQVRSESVKAKPMASASSSTPGSIPRSQKQTRLVLDRQSRLEEAAVARGRGNGRKWGAFAGLGRDDVLKKSRIDRRNNTLGMTPDLEEALHLNSPTANRPADNHHRRMRSFWIMLPSLPWQIVHLVLTLFISIVHLCTKLWMDINRFLVVTVHFCTSLWMDVSRFLVKTVHFCTSLWMDVSHFLMETVDGSVILGVFVNTLSFLIVAYKLYIGIPFLVISVLLLILRRRREANTPSSSSRHY